MHCIAAVLVLGACAVSAQFFEPIPQTLTFIQPPPLRQPSFQPIFKQVEVPSKRTLAHRAVLINAENEARLPAELVRSKDFYNNPRTAQALAKDSWFGPGEERVVNREADKIPRSQIVKLLRQAGFARRR